MESASNTDSNSLWVRLFLQVAELHHLPLWWCSQARPFAALTRLVTTRANWQTALEQFRSSSASGVETLYEVLGELPEAITLRELESDYQVAFSQCSLKFPSLVREKREHPIKVRDRALHHLGEAARVATAV